MRGVSRVVMLGVRPETFKVHKRRAYDGAAELTTLFRSDHLPPFQTEFRFHPTRKWRFDFAWPEKKIAVEYEGCTWAAGRHVRGAGFAKDCEKYNAAVLLGWRVLRFTSDMVRSGHALETVEQIFGRGAV